MEHLKTAFLTVKGMIYVTILYVTGDSLTFINLPHISQDIKDWFQVGAWLSAIIVAMLTINEKTKIFTKFFKWIKNLFKK